MAVLIRRLGAASNIAANTSTTIYTVPTGRAAMLRSLHFGGTTDITFTVELVLGSLIIPFLSPTLVKGASGLALPLSTVLKSGDSVRVIHSATGGYTMLQGAEFDFSPPTLHRESVTDVGTTLVSLATPAGLRFRIREVIIAYAATGGIASLAINNVGYVVRRTMVANENLIAGVDMSVNPGESLGYSVSAGTAHFYLSGVREDA